MQTHLLADSFGIMDDSLLSTMSAMVGEEDVCVVHERIPDPERVNMWLSSFAGFAHDAHEQRSNKRQKHIPRGFVALEQGDVRRFAHDVMEVACEPPNFASYHLHMGHVKVDSSIIPSDEAYYETLFRMRSWLAMRGVAHVRADRLLPGDVATFSSHMPRFLLSSGDETGIALEMRSETRGAVVTCLRGQVSLITFPNMPRAFQEELVRLRDIIGTPPGMAHGGPRAAAALLERIPVYDAQRPLHTARLEADLDVDNLERIFRMLPPRDVTLVCFAISKAFRRRFWPRLGVVQHSILAPWSNASPNVSFRLRRLERKLVKEYETYVLGIQVLDQLLHVVRNVVRPFYFRLVEKRRVLCVALTVMQGTSKFRKPLDLRVPEQTPIDTDIRLVFRGDSMDVDAIYIPGSTTIYDQGMRCLRDLYEFLYPNRDMFRDEWLVPLQEFGTVNEDPQKIEWTEHNNDRLNGFTYHRREGTGEAAWHWYDNLSLLFQRHAYLFPDCCVANRRGTTLHIVRLVDD